MRDPDILKPGTELFGYRVLKLVGRGAWAYVYEAEHPNLPRHVAIKQLKSVWAANEDVLQRFLREADIVTQLNHPNIVTIYDKLQDKETGTWYIVTEFAEKGTLADRLKESPGGLPIDEVYRIVRGICSGLEVVHKKEIIHRDVKPDNILMVDVGESQDIPKLTDFGIARVAVIPGTLVPRSLGVYGSIHYMAPERLDVYTVDDHRCDLYSLGITLYQLLTGQVPFTGTDTDIYWAHLYIRPKLPGDLRTGIPESLEQIVLRALQKDRRLRYQSAAEMRKALEAVQRISEQQKLTRLLHIGRPMADKLGRLLLLGDLDWAFFTTRWKQVALTLLVLALIVSILFLMSNFLPKPLINRILIPGITPTYTRVSTPTTTATTMVTAQATESYTPTTIPPIPTLELPPTYTPTPPPTNTPTHTGTPTNIPTHTGTPTNIPTHTGTPTKTPTPTLTATPQLTGPITLTIYFRDTLTEAGFAALSDDQVNGGKIYQEKQTVYGDAAMQIGETTYHFDKPLPDPWRVEFEFDELLVARTGDMEPGFDPKKAQFWVGTLDSDSAVGEDNPYSLTMQLYEGSELRESIQVFFTVKDAPDPGGEGDQGGKPPPPE